MTYFVRYAFNGRFTTDYKQTNAEGFKIAKSVFKVLSEANWGDIKLLVVENR